MSVHKAKGLEFHTVFLPELIKRGFLVSNMGGKKYWLAWKRQNDLSPFRILFFQTKTRPIRFIASCCVSLSRSEKFRIIIWSYLWFTVMQKSERHAMFTPCVAVLSLSWRSVSSVSSFTNRWVPLSTPEMYTVGIVGLLSEIFKLNNESLSSLRALGEILMFRRLFLLEHRKGLTG